MKKILEIKNIKKYYQTKEEEIHAIEDVSFDVYENNFISIVGPSGCGKSTLLSIICNLENKTEGQINSSENIKYGFMFQKDTLFEFLNIFDNCMLPLKIKNKINKDTKEECTNLLKKYNLYDFKDKYPSELSGGMRQRVSLIRTLIINPDILLLDEPFSALDAQNRLMISNDVYDIIKKENKTTIMVTHDVEEAVSMSDYVIVLTNRPSKIKNIYKINLNKKLMPIENRLDEKFNYYCKKIWEDLDVTRKN